MRYIIAIIYLLMFSTLFSQDASDLLLKAYKTNSTVLLDSFFHKWSADLKPIKKRQLESSNDTTKAIYELVKLFYSPQCLNSYLDSNNIFEENFGYKPKFFVLYDTLDITVADSIIHSEHGNYLKWGNYSHRTIIRNFRPDLLSSSRTILILNNYYDKLINQFLGNSFATLAKRPWEPQEPNGETKKRYEFIKDYILCTYRDEAKRWFFHSSPKPTEVIMDRSLNRAYIKSKFLYIIKETFFEKRNGTWECVETDAIGSVD